MAELEIPEETLIYDLETATDGKPDAENDILRVFAGHSYRTNKPYLLTKSEQIEKIWNAHKFIVGFNIFDYDNPIMARARYNMSKKIFIDLMVIMKSRASQMKTEKGMLGDLLMEYSLDYITRTLGIVNDEEAKLELDYSILRKPVWTPEERQKIIEYTKRDIEITKKLYEWIEHYFEGFKDFVHPEDVENKGYLTLSIAKFAYKAICKAMNWSETYGGDNPDDEKIGGGYVGYPAGERFEGDIYCIDFNSLYPFIMIMCNLYGQVTDPEKIPTAWHGGGMWEVEGYYDTENLSGVGKLLLKWYGDRLEYKHQGDRREYTIKIIINTIYGILNNPYYLRTYNRVAGGDCTRIGRQWTKYARKVFRDDGYNVIYTDTDSVYIVDPFHDKERMLATKQKIIDKILSTVPFPQKEIMFHGKKKALFDMGIDDEIKYMYFFKGKNKGDKDTDSEMDDMDFINKPKGLMKKNYIYVTKDNRVVIKNLGIRKKSVSALSKKIFWDKLVPKMKEGQVKFKKSLIKKWMDDYLDEDIKLAFMRKSVGKFEQYEKTSPNSMPAQVAKRYGAGIHFLIPNSKMIGVGKDKDKRFCTYEEFKQHNMTKNDIDTENFWKELNYFVKPIVEKNIFDFE